MTAAGLEAAPARDPRPDELAGQARPGRGRGALRPRRPGPRPADRRCCLGAPSVPFPGLREDLWKRYLQIILDGLRPDGATKLRPGPAAAQALREPRAPATSAAASSVRVRHVVAAGLAAQARAGRQAGRAPRPSTTGSSSFDGISGGVRDRHLRAARRLRLGERPDRLVAADGAHRDPDRASRPGRRGPGSRAGSSPWSTSSPTAPACRAFAGSAPARAWCSSPGRASPGRRAASRSGRRSPCRRAGPPRRSPAGRPAWPRSAPRPAALRRRARSCSRSAARSRSSAAVPAGFWVQSYGGVAVQRPFGPPAGVAGEVGRRPRGRGGVELVLAALARPLGGAARRRRRGRACAPSSPGPATC